MTVTLDGTDGNARDQRTRSSPTLATYSFGPVQGEAVAGEPGRLTAVLGPEPRLPDPAALAAARARVEPVAVGTPGVLAGLHQRDRGHLGQPRPFWPGLGQRDHATLQFGVAELLPGQGGTAPFGEGVVVNHPGAPERSGERLALAGSRVDAVAVPDEHAAKYLWSMRQDDDDRRGRHVVAALNVQLILVTKDRRGVLTGEHLGTLGEVFAGVGADVGAELVELDGEDDHVHLLVTDPRQVAVARLVNSRK